MQGALEDDRSLPPTNRPELAELHREHVLAAEQHLPGDGGVRRRQAQHGGGEGRLAAAGLPGDPEDLAAVDRQGHVAHGRDRARAGAVHDAQVAHLEQCHQRSRRRGFRTVSRARPIKVKARTTRMIAMPGG